MKTILLTNSDQVALVDDQDYEYLNSFTWHLGDRGYPACGVYAQNNTKVRRMHRLIYPQFARIDHKDTNKLNNQRDNLRLTTQTQNNGNRNILAKKTTRSKSIYKGVSWHTTDQCWHAQIQYAYKKYFLGRFDNEIDAAKAYNAKALELFREYARLNEV